jgi:trehalose 6-phosphate synthase/phosphatase
VDAEFTKQQLIVTPKLVETLEILCNDERNSVYILSGKPKSLIDTWFAKIEKVTLAAEYGYHYRPSGDPEWKVADFAQSQEWKKIAMEIIKWFTDKTDRSYIEFKDSSLVWVYRECDPELGMWQAKDLQKALKGALKPFSNITIVSGKGYVEAKPKNLQKGHLVASIIQQVAETKGDIDFIFCAGDDIGDEEMFKQVNLLYPQDSPKRKATSHIKDCATFTCTVGRKPSNAAYYVNDHYETVKLLQGMADLCVKASHFSISTQAL